MCRKVGGFAWAEGIGAVIDVEMEYHRGERVWEGTKSGGLKEHVL